MVVARLDFPINNLNQLFVFQIVKNIVFGLLAINKPSGITSRTAVDIVKKLVKPNKIGHTGTLDPLACGVLVLCIGPATRLAKYVQEMPKSYIGDFQLGVTSESDDSETELVPVSDAIQITQAQMDSVLPKFIGDIQQVPPKYSAVKIGGRRAYKLSRAGQDVEIQPRTVSIHSISLLDFEYPNFKLKIDCGSGTYIRSLGRDIGLQLGSGAVMTNLVRDAVGEFDIASAISTDDLTAENIEQHLAEPIRMFTQSEIVELTDVQIGLLKNGHVFSSGELSVAANAEQVVAKSEKGNLLAIMERNAKGSLKPAINFVHYYLD